MQKKNSRIQCPSIKTKNFETSLAKQILKQKLEADYYGIYEKVNKKPQNCSFIEDFKTKIMDKLVSEEMRENSQANALKIKWETEKAKTQRYQGWLENKIKKTKTELEMIKAEQQEVKDFALKQNEQSKLKITDELEEVRGTYPKLPSFLQGNLSKNKKIYDKFRLLKTESSSQEKLDIFKQVLEWIPSLQTDKKQWYCYSARLLQLTKIIKTLNAEIDETIVRKADEQRLHLRWNLKDINNLIIKINNKSDDVNKAAQNKQKKKKAMQAPQDRVAKKMRVAHDPPQKFTDPAQGRQADRQVNPPIQHEMCKRRSNLQGNENINSQMTDSLNSLNISHNDSPPQIYDEPVLEEPNPFGFPEHEIELPKNIYQLITTDVNIPQMELVSQNIPPQKIDQNQNLKQSIEIESLTMPTSGSQILNPDSMIQRDFSKAFLQNEHLSIEKQTQTKQSIKDHFPDQHTRQLNVIQSIRQGQYTDTKGRQLENLSRTDKCQEYCYFYDESLRCDQCSKASGK